MATRRRRQWSLFWPVVLFGAATALLLNGATKEGLLVAVVWLVHVLFLNPTLCRVEKRGDGDPCTNPASGMLGTCSLGGHRGATWQALPHVVRVGRIGWPRLMWPNPSTSVTGRRTAAARHPAPPPSPASGRTEVLGTVLAVASLLVALLSLARDVIAG